MKKEQVIETTVEHNFLKLYSAVFSKPTCTFINECPTVFD